MGQSILSKIADANSHVGSLANPGTGNVIDLRGGTLGFVVLTTGTYVLPDSPRNTRLTVYALTAPVTLNTQSGSTTWVISDAGTCVELMANTATTWKATSSSGVLSDAKTSQAFIPLPLTGFREVSTGAVGNAAANGGLLASDTTPTLTPVNGATDATQIVTWASSNNDVLMIEAPLPPDINTDAAIVFNAEIASGGTTNAVGFTVGLHAPGVADSGASGTNQTTSFATVTRSSTIALSGVRTLTVLLTPVAHTTDTLIMRAAYLTYTRKLLTS